MIASNMLDVPMWHFASAQLHISHLALTHNVVTCGRVVEDFLLRDPATYLRLLTRLDPLESSLAKFRVYRRQREEKWKVRFGIKQRIDQVINDLGSSDRPAELSKTIRSIS